MALVFVGAIHQYFLDHPKGVMPGQHYLRAYIKPFTDLHTLEARMNPLSQHERELAADSPWLSASHNLDHPSVSRYPFAADPGQTGLEPVP